MGAYIMMILMAYNIACILFFGSIAISSGNWFLLAFCITSGIFTLLCILVGNQALKLKDEVATLKSDKIESILSKIIGDDK
jgi:hypothetical protein